MKGLISILDSMIYSQELLKFSNSYNFVYNFKFFLLITSDLYFIYNIIKKENRLHLASDTLKNIYNVIKD